jgi:hypothetical protein
VPVPAPLETEVVDLPPQWVHETGLVNEVAETVVGETERLGGRLVEVVGDMW